MDDKTHSFTSPSIFGLLTQHQLGWSIFGYTARDAAGVGVGDALTLAVSRNDDPLAGVVVPTSKGANPSAALPSHLQRLYADQLSQGGVPDPGFEGRTDLRSNDDYRAYIEGRLAVWKAWREGS
jgi:phospholipase C